MIEANIIPKFKKFFKSKVHLKNLNLPKIFSQDIKILSTALQEKEISTYGKYTSLFEKKLSQYTKSNYVISTINGTAALQVAMIVAGVCKNHEVLMPSFNYISGANAASYCGATPHFVDIESDTLGVCPKSLEKYLIKNTKKKGSLLINKKTKREIKILLILHAFGHPPKILELKEVAKKFNLIIIEDAAAALGSFYKGEHAGTFGEIGILSFNGNKIITTGGGGAILTKSKNIAEKAKKIINNGKKIHKWKFIFETKGFNYRLPSINAALGISQLKNLKKLIKNNRVLFSKYKEFFKNFKYLNLFKEPKFCRSNYWLQTLILDKKISYKRDKLINHMISQGIEARAAWELLSSTKMYKDCPKMKLEVSKNLVSRIINLPSRLI